MAYGDYGGGGCWTGEALEPMQVKIPRGPSHGRQRYPSRWWRIYFASRLRWWLRREAGTDWCGGCRKVVEVAGMLKSLFRGRCLECGRRANERAKVARAARDKRNKGKNKP